MRPGIAVGDAEFRHFLPVRSYEHGIAGACAIRNVLDGYIGIAAQVLLQRGGFARSDTAFQMGAEDTSPDGLQLSAF